MMLPSEALGQIWAEYVAALHAELERDLASISRDPDPQGDADLAALLATLEPM